jgi:predicted cupin superfamily sugar epimerase
MLSKINFLAILDQILSNENLLEEEKTRIENIKENKKELPEKLTANRLIKHLDLITIKGVTDEDGYFKEFVKIIDQEGTITETEIFYLLKEKQVSCLHSLDTTETWRWLGGKEISIFIFTKQEAKEIILSETNPSHTIEKGTLFGAKITNLTDDNDFGMVTCKCTPGFVLEHYKSPSKEEIDTLSKTYPNHGQIIKELTPNISNTSKNLMQSIMSLFSCCTSLEKSEEQTPLIIASTQNNRQ